MQLDKTSIVIATRSLSDTLDLSLMVLRHYWKGILLYSLMGVLPFALLNFVLTWPITQYDELEYTSYAEGLYAEFYRVRYYWIMICTVTLQAPLAFAFVTKFIGQSIFEETQSAKHVFQSMRPIFVAVLWVLGGLRLGLLSYIPLISLYLYPAFDAMREVGLFLFVLFGWAILVRSIRPFAPEILILEGCPLRGRESGPDQVLSYRRRSKWLYHALGGETFGTFFTMLIITSMLTWVLCLGIVFTLGVLFGLWDWGMWMDWFCFPAVLWGVGAWVTVVRFLCYSDARIRIEGWELQLKLRAEAARLESANA